MSARCPLRHWLSFLLALFAFLFIAVVDAQAQTANLAVSKIVNNATPNVGSNVTFTITVTNSGPSTATGVSATDQLPPGLSLVSATPSVGSYTSVTGVWVIGTMANAATATLQIVASVVSPNAQTNTATVTSSVTDPNLANNSASATVTPQKADLAVVKTVNNATPNVGDTITFTITLTNAGPNAATGVAATDVLPAGLSFVSATVSQGTYVLTGGAWAVGTVASGGNATMSIAATVVSPDARTNTATISDADQFDPNTANNSASATVTPRKANLAVVKTVNNATPNVGNTITFTITLTNAGPDAATNVAVTDLLPAGLTFVSATTSQGTYNSTNGAWTVGTQTTSVPNTLSIAATVTSANVMSNTAAITAADQFDPVTGNNSSSVTVTPLKADLTVAKIVSNATPNIGTTISFTVTVTNAGPNTATGIAATDLLPAGLTFVSATPSLGAYNSVNGAWTVGTLANGANAALQLQATVTVVTRISNTATISAANQFDPVLGNNAATVTVTPRFTDDPLATGGTQIRAVHVTQLRARIDAQRSRFGLGAFGWTNPSLGPSVQVRAIHVTELRTALQQAYSSGFFTPPSFTDSPLVVGSTMIRALHINELRSAVIALEGM
jgi:uncharacterized repeat protein (TIGR01451 family)